ncbi:MAG: NAD-dependent succinate-semialdehyde dehydrogenase [Flavobacteriales bacterium]
MMSSRDKIFIINPATEEKVAAYARNTPSEVKDKIIKSKAAFNVWKTTSFEERATAMRKLASLLLNNTATHAALITQEMGKTIEQARKEVEKCALVCNYYADHAESLLQNVTVDTEATKSYVTFQPLGVILAIMPWNFPFYQVIRFAAPAIMAGNTGVLKHASNVQGCAFILEALFDKAGFPEGVFTNLNVSSETMENIIGDKHIAAVTLTGSEAAGRSVAAIAGKHLKKTVLELGGSDAYIILEDADLEAATDLATFGRLQNNGQTCIAAKRFIVLETIYDDFVDLLKKKMEAKKMGDPMDEDTYYGPLARMDLRDQLHEQVTKTLEQGATLVLGGYIPDDKGAYYPATILGDVKPGMEGFDEELFGPVASIIMAKNDSEAIALANNSKFGLGSGVITSNKERGEYLALQLEAGNSFVNKLVTSDPRLPFGGVKNSGYGRELSGYGIKEFVNIKTVWVD